MKEKAQRYIQCEDGAIKGIGVESKDWKYSYLLSTYDIVNRLNE